MFDSKLFSQVGASDGFLAATDERRCFLHCHQRFKRMVATIRAICSNRQWLTCAAYRGLLCACAVFGGLATLCAGLHCVLTDEMLMPVSQMAAMSSALPCGSHRPGHRVKSFLWNTGGMYRVELYATVRRSVYVEGSSARRRAVSGWPARRCARCCATAGRPGIAGRSRSGVRWTPSRGSSIRSSARISPVGSNGTRPSCYARSMASRAASRSESLRARAAAERAGDVCAAGTSAGRRAGRLRRSLGGDRRGRYLVVDLPHSDDGFVQAFPAETTEAFCEGHNAAFRYFGGVPRRIVYDNTKLAVARILGDGTRQRTQVFSELQSHYLFDARFGRPGKGNDKGTVEGLVGYARRNFFVPIPRFASWDALNARAPVNVAAAGYGGTPRRSGNGSPATARRCCRYRRSRMTPAIHGRRGSPHCRWCATAATTTPCRPPTATGRCW